MRMEQFPKELAERIRDGMAHGVTDDQMVKGIVSLGNLLGRFVKPDTPEEALLKEMWDVADENEKYTMANLVLRLGKKYAH